MFANFKVSRGPGVTESGPDRMPSNHRALFNAQRQFHSYACSVCYELRRYASYTLLRHIFLIIFFAISCNFFDIILNFIVQKFYSTNFQTTSSPIVQLYSIAIPFVQPNNRQGHIMKDQFIQKTTISIYNSYFDTQYTYITQYTTSQVISTRRFESILQRSS